MINSTGKTHNRNIDYLYFNENDGNDFRYSSGFKDFKARVLAVVKSRRSATYREIKTKLGENWKAEYFDLALAELEAERAVVIDESNPLITRIKAV